MVMSFSHSIFFISSFLPSDAFVVALCSKCSQTERSTAHRTATVKTDLSSLGSGLINIYWADDNYDIDLD